MRNEYTWEIKATNTPLLIKKCSRCNHDRFYSSEKFRVNAQKKNIDVWLIYRCQSCDCTTNMTIFSRVKTGAIDKSLYLQLSENDPKMAWTYAFSDAIKLQNHIAFDFGSVNYEINHDGITLEDILMSDNDTITFYLRYPFDFNLKLSKVIRTCLNVSSKTLEKLINLEVISVQGQCLHKKHKVKDNHMVKIDVKALRFQLEFRKKNPGD